MWRVIYNTCVYKTAFRSCFSFFVQGASAARLFLSVMELDLPSEISQNSKALTCCAEAASLFDQWETDPQRRVKPSGYRCSALLELMVLQEVLQNTDRCLLYLSNHGLGQDLSSLGSADDIGSLEQDLGSVLDGLQVPFFPGCYRRQDGLVDKLLHRHTRNQI